MKYIGFIFDMEIDLNQFRQDTVDFLDMEFFILHNNVDVPNQKEIEKIIKIPEYATDEMVLNIYQKGYENIFNKKVKKAIGNYIVSKNENNREVFNFNKEFIKYIEEDYVNKSTRPTDFNLPYNRLGKLINDNPEIKDDIIEEFKEFTKQYFKDNPKELKQMANQFESDFNCRPSFNFGDSKIWDVLALQYSIFSNLKHNDNFMLGFENHIYQTDLKLKEEKIEQKNKNRLT